MKESLVKWIYQWIAHANPNISLPPWIPVTCHFWAQYFELFNEKWKTIQHNSKWLSLPLSRLMNGLAGEPLVKKSLGDEVNPPTRSHFGAKPFRREIPEEDFRLRDIMRITQTHGLAFHLIPCMRLNFKSDSVPPSASNLSHHAS